MDEAEQTLGGTAMGILLVIAMVWLAVRIVAVVRILAAGPDEEFRAQDARTPADAPRVEPQDAPWHPQDAVSSDVTTGSAPRDPDPGGVLTVAVWRIVADTLRELAARRVALAEAARDDGGSSVVDVSRAEWLTALRQTIVSSVVRPDAGPACFGGRDEAAYLRGWDDAVDWISQGRDAAAPTWGDIAYMTGWNDAGRQIASARRTAPAWPSAA